MLELRIRELLAVKLGQLAGGRDGVADLSSVHVVLGQLADVVTQVVIVDLSFSQVLETVEEVAPDLAALGLREVFVVQRQLDAGFEGLVERPDAVGGEDEDSVVVL